MFSKLGVLRIPLNPSDRIILQLDENSCSRILLILKPLNLVRLLTIIIINLARIYCKEEITLRVRSKAYSSYYHSQIDINMVNMENKSSIWLSLYHCCSAWAEADNLTL